MECGIVACRLWGGGRQVSGLALWIRWVLYELRCLLGASFVLHFASLRIEGRIPREAWTGEINQREMERGLA